MDNNAKSLEKDLIDSPRDQEKLKQDETTFELPDVKDIPGQEHIRVPVMNELADTTASSDDEEGDDVLGNPDEEELDEEEDEADVTPLERSLLDEADSDVPSDDNDRLKRTALDDTDEDGEPLNEASMGTDVTGADIDSGGLEDDDPMESIGEEDEENNQYSLGGDLREDNSEDGTV